MEKQKKWQFYLILAVILLTLYNILPTVFYYTKPLKSDVDATYAENVALGIIDRVDTLEADAKQWLYSFSDLLGVKPTAIELQKGNPHLIEVSFKNNREAEVFRRFLPRAGDLIPFVPSQLSVNTAPGNALDQNKVLVARQVSVHLNPSEVKDLFAFSSKQTSGNVLTPIYKEITNDRVANLALGFGGVSREGLQLEALAKAPLDKNYDEVVNTLASNLVEANRTFKGNSSILKRYYANFAQVSSGDNKSDLATFQKLLDEQHKRFKTQQETLVDQKKELAKKNLELEEVQENQLQILEKQIAALGSASTILKNNLTDFKGGKPLTLTSIAEELASADKTNSVDTRQTVNLLNSNPFVEALIIDWNSSKVFLKFFDDIQEVRLSENTPVYLKEKMNQYVINSVAVASQQADESIEPSENTFVVSLDSLIGSKSFLLFNLGYLAEKRSQELTEELKNNWNPQHPELSSDLFPIHSYAEYKNLPLQDQKLGLVIYVPVIEKEAIPEGFHSGSIYVIAKGLDAIIQKYQQNPEGEYAKLLMGDVNALSDTLRQNGFIGYSGASFGISNNYNKDFIFELSDYYNNLLKATRENFIVKGSKRHAVLEFTDVEQRMLALNKIDDRIQEDLLKWKEAYESSQVDISATNRYQVPAPTKNIYWENFKLSFKKFFRGDDRKILKWGLDLSGGKTVRIGLRDHNNRPVTNPDELKQAVNQLYTRINNLGVSERTIHIEDNNIILDFPGSQNLSAAELIKASSMYFHFINEKFTPGNPELKSAVNTFLQNVWNEALVTNRKDIESINEIAWQHLGAENELNQPTRPLTEAAKVLYDNGLRLADPNTASSSHAFNDTLSAVGMLKGEDFIAWEGNSNPLIFIFHNYALEGANLSNVHTGYDPMKGNTLSFGVSRSYASSQESGNPQDDLYTWTSQFAADKIIGTPKEAYGHDKGWRMAVILNGTIITMPGLSSALKDGGTITGRFSQREVNQLAADLKAGSLSFTPRILSEENVSPELGSEERTKGIVASLVALGAVVVAMVGYYHFAGAVASVAVLLNILIMWGVLQNLGAALSLPSIAGIVLTIGMAVDANVLVFERIREEFALSGRIGSAIQAGYRKAFSAIIDSNITTIIAALILIQFDSGPIKGFAVALIVGIISSMFTSLFVTRYFFAGWAQNPKNRSLHMSQFFTLTHFDFLGQAKKAFIISGIVMILGSALFYAQRNTMFGMDLTGGYALNLEVEEQKDITNYRLKALEALQATGISSNDVQVRELSRPNQLRIQLGMGMEEPGHPFYQMVDGQSEGKLAYEYQSSPRLTWVVDALEKGGLTLSPSQLSMLDQNWTAMSGQFSETMRNNMILGLTLAFLSVLIYITLRFEFKCAVGAVVGLLHDVIITMGILALFHWLGFAVQVDLQVVGAIMTIIGYSLNDTIIVFDRIREDLRVMRKLSFRGVVNHALNVTLSRTVMTSGTTLLVLLALVFLGGKSIFAFSLVMTIGVIVGTISSLYIASPVMLYIHDREVKSRELDQQVLRRA
ncbi:MAG: protein translocase subunit SecD [Parachlamydiaceae bacterium]|nr:protein translocase subunit SecD [Parachlamydiaceae bacterium]